MKPDEAGYVRIAIKVQALEKNGQIDTKGCEHLADIREVSPAVDGCEKCLEMGDEWVNLRLCLTCGHVGCCDNSKNTHATKHFHEVGHPVIVSFEPGEEWLWCYTDQVSVSA